MLDVCCMIMGFAFLPNIEPVLWLCVRWYNQLIEACIAYFLVEKSQNKFILRATANQSGCPDLAEEFQGPSNQAINEPLQKTVNHVAKLVHKQAIILSPRWLRWVYNSTGQLDAHGSHHNYYVDRSESSGFRKGTGTSQYQWYACGKNVIVPGACFYPLSFSNPIDNIL